MNDSPNCALYQLSALTGTFKGLKQLSPDKSGLKVRTQRGQSQRQLSGRDVDHMFVQCTLG